MPDEDKSPFADSNLKPDETVAEDAFNAFWARVTNKDYTFNEADTSILSYGVACTTFPNDGYESVINKTVLEIIMGRESSHLNRNTEEDKNNPLLNFFNDNVAFHLSHEMQTHEHAKDS